MEKKTQKGKKNGRKQNQDIEMGGGGKSELEKMVLVQRKRGRGKLLQKVSLVNYKQTVPKHECSSKFYSITINNS